MQADLFLNVQAVMIILFGLVAFIMDQSVVWYLPVNLFRRKRSTNDQAAGISAFPMSSRIQKKWRQTKILKTSS